MTIYMRYYQVLKNKKSSNKQPQNKNLFDVDDLFKEPQTKEKDDGDALNVGDDFGFDEYIKKQQT